MWTSCLSVADPIDTINHRFDHLINNKMKEYASNLLFVQQEQHRKIKRKFNVVSEHSTIKQEHTEDISILLDDYAILLRDLTRKYADVIHTLCEHRKGAIGKVFDEMHRISEKFGLFDQTINMFWSTVMVF